MKPFEVQNKETLKAYLYRLPDELIREVAVRVATRAALRVLPIAALEFVQADWARSQNAKPFSLFRSCAIAAVASFRLTDGVGVAAGVAAANDDAAAATLAVNKPGSTFSTYSASSADSAIRLAAMTVESACFTESAIITDVFDNSSNAAHYANLGAFRVTNLDLWPLIRADLQDKEADLRAEGFPAELRAIWDKAKPALRALDPSWEVWILWYERIMSGRNWHPEAMWDVLKTFTKKEDWQSDPITINRKFDPVLELYLAEDGEDGDIPAPASPFEFTFDDLAKVMRLIGIDDNLRHLQEPEVVQSFLNDGEEVRDGFIDFVDDARDMQGGNFVGPLRKRAERIVTEFSRIEDNVHIRAERVVMLAQDLELFSKDQKALEDLGETLFLMLQSRLEQLKRLCRRHFGPSYVSLAPLANLKLEQIDKDEVVRILDEALARMDALPSDELYSLDAEGKAVLNDMLDELRETRAAISNATDEEFVAILEARFAESSSALGLSIGKFYERSSEAMGHVSRRVDVAIRTQKRAQGVDAIIDAVRDLGGSGGA